MVLNLVYGHRKVRFPPRFAPTDVAAFDSSNHAFLLENSHPTVKPREVDLHSPIGVDRKMGEIQR